MTPIRSAEMNELLAMVLASGIVQEYAGATPPSGWLLCDGSSLLRTDYPDLFAAIGTKYGSADGLHFNVPDCRGRVPVGKDGTAEFLDLGTTGGEKAHTLTSAEMPSHYHSVDPPATVSGGITANHSHNIQQSCWSEGMGSTNWGARYGSPERGFKTDSWLTMSGVTSDHAHWTDIGVFNSGSAGSGTAHNNLQPYVVFNFIIKI